MSIKLKIDCFDTSSSLPQTIALIDSETRKRLGANLGDYIKIESSDSRSGIFEVGKMFKSYVGQGKVLLHPLLDKTGVFTRGECVDVVKAGLGDTTVAKLMRDSTIRRATIISVVLGSISVCLGLLALWLSLNR
jgi:hypothetical protein